MSTLLPSASVFFSSRRRHTRYWRDWSSDVCSSDLLGFGEHGLERVAALFHLGEDEVAGTVEDAGERDDAIARNAFTQDGVDGDAPCHAGFHGEEIGRASCRERV